MPPQKNGKLRDGGLLAALPARLVEQGRGDLVAALGLVGQHVRVVGHARDGGLVIEPWSYETFEVVVPKKGYLNGEYLRLSIPAEQFTIERGD